MNSRHTVHSGSASSREHDLNSHLVPKTENEQQSYSKLQEVTYLITSTILTSIFLFILMFLALVQRLFKHFKGSQNTTEHTAGQYGNMNITAAEMKLVPDLAYYFNLLGLRVDIYEVITEDGFVLQMQRLVDPRETLAQKQKRKPMLLVHGLLQSSGSFCSSGKNSLAYYFFQQGYDIWLGNNRCGFEPRHLYYEPNDYKMWDWDILDMAQYDITCFLDNVLKNCDCQNEKIVLICHSQGTTQGFINLDNDRFQNSSKIKSFVALSPAVYGGSLLEEKYFIKVIAKMSLNHYFFGIKSFLPIMMTMRSLLVRTKIFGFLSYSMFSYLFDWNDNLWDQNLKYRHFLFSPVYVSVKLMSWWLNDKSGFKISKAILEHEKKWFDDEVTPPVFLVIPKKDKLVDGQKVVDHLLNYETFTKFGHIFLDEYSHLDVLWSKNVIKDVGEPILEFIKAL